MKRYINVSDNSIIYMGLTSDIKAMYKSIVRAYHKYATDLIPLFSETRFSETRMTYGIVIDEDSFFYSISSDTFTAMLLTGELVEVKEGED
jgi:hypothetical protein